MPPHTITLFRLAFAAGASLKRLTLAWDEQLVGSLSKRHAVIPTNRDFYRLYADGFRFYFTPFLRVLFTFPSRYWYTIGHRGVFSLGGWSPRIHAGFHVSRATQEHSSYDNYFAYRTITFFGPPFQACSAKQHTISSPLCYSTATIFTYNTYYATPASFKL